MIASDDGQILLFAAVALLMLRRDKLLKTSEDQLPLVVSRLHVFSDASDVDAVFRKAAELRSHTLTIQPFVPADYPFQGGLYDWTTVIRPLQLLAYVSDPMDADDGRAQPMDEKAEICVIDCRPRAEFEAAPVQELTPRVAMVNHFDPSGIGTTSNSNTKAAVGRLRDICE